MQRESAFAIWFLLALSLAGCARPVVNPGEAEAVAAILKLNGKIEFDETSPVRPAIKVYLHNTAVKDGDLIVLPKLTKLENLFLGKTQITDAGLEHLRGASELKTLSLNGTQVTDAGLKPLAGLKNLKTLNLQDTKVTSTGITELRQALPGVNIPRGG